jgi:hypothetical protein
MCVTITLLCNNFCTWVFISSCIPVGLLKPGAIDLVSFVLGKFFSFSAQTMVHNENYQMTWFLSSVLIVFFF